MMAHLSVMVGVVLLAYPVSAAGPIHHYGEACDGSAAVALTATTFVSASDDDNVLRVYEIGQREPIARYDLAEIFPDSFLHLPKKHKELDVEGAAMLDGTIYWITSHGSGKENRRRLFATRIDAGHPKPEPFGSAAYESLIQDLNNTASWKGLGIQKAAKKEPDEPGGLNIEGLAASPGALLVGFRNPLPDMKAVVLQMTNLDRLKKGQTPAFSPPIFLDLGGLGVRSLNYSAQRHVFFIVAGPAAKKVAGPVYKLYEWDGPPARTVQ